MLPNSTVLAHHYFVGDEIFPLRLNLLRHMQEGICWELHNEFLIIDSQGHDVLLRMLLEFS